MTYPQIHKRSALSLLLFSALLRAGVSSCRKDELTFTPASNTLPALDFFLKLIPEQQTQTTFPLNGATLGDTMLLTSSGVRIFLTDPNTLFKDANGNPVPCVDCQSVTLRVTEVFSKGDMPARDINSENPEGILPESAGILYLEAFCDGKPLQIMEGRTLKIQIPAATPNLLTDMRIWNAALNADGAFDYWTMTPAVAYWADWLPSGGSGTPVKGYEIYPGALGWVNCARPLNSSPAVSGQFCVKLSEAFNGENSVCYLAYKNRLILLEAQGQAGNREFCFGSVVEGFPIRVLVISKIGAQYYSATFDTESSANATINLSPQAVEAQTLKQTLKSL